MKGVIMSNTTDKGVYTIVSKDDIEIAASILKHPLTDFGDDDDIHSILESIENNEDLLVLESAKTFEYTKTGKLNCYIYVYDDGYKDGIGIEEYAENRAFYFSKRVTPKEHLEALDEVLWG